MQLASEHVGRSDLSKRRQKTVAESHNFPQTKISLEWY